MEKKYTKFNEGVFDMNQNIKGVYPVVPTIFKENGKVDYTEFENLIEYLIDNGVHGLTYFGFGSEFYKLSDKEKDKLMDCFLKTTKKKTFSIVSITEHTTKNAIKWAQKAQLKGSNAIMLLPPYLTPISTTSLIEHVKSVINYIDLPVIIQYAPQETGVVLKDDFFIELSKNNENDIYVKVESVPSGPLITKLTNLGINVIIGHGGKVFFEGLERGALGVMPGCAVHDIMLHIYDYYINNKKNKALKILNKTLPYLHFVGQDLEMFLASEKFFLSLRGIIKNIYTRKPNYALDQTQKYLIKKYYKDFTEIIEYDLKK